MTDLDFAGQGRADETRRERRRRGDETLAPSAKLVIPPEVQKRLDAQGLVPRWANDEGNRIHRLTVGDDYDPVEGVPPVPAGTDKLGKPIMAHLLAKKRDFIEEDKTRSEARRRAAEEGMFKSPDAIPNEGGNNPRPQQRSQTYVAKGTRIERSNQIIE